MTGGGVETLTGGRLVVMVYFGSSFVGGNNQQE
jgi:hypothetical protein